MNTITVTRELTTEQFAQQTTRRLIQAMQEELNSYAKDTDGEEHAAVNIICTALNSHPQYSVVEGAIRDTISEILSDEFIPA